MTATGLTPNFLVNDINPSYCIDRSEHVINQTNNRLVDFCPSERPKARSCTPHALINYSLLNDAQMHEEGAKLRRRAMKR